MKARAVRELLLGEPACGTVAGGANHFSGLRSRRVAGTALRS
jgi:hypothetical protein